MNRPIAVIISGHPRSKTTPLNHLCNLYPAVKDRLASREVQQLECAAMGKMKRLEYI